MAKEKSTAPSKPGKKEMRHQIEEVLMKKAAEMINESAVSKQLHKKIKKAGKLIVDGILEATKSASKAAKPSKNAILKKSVTKKSPPKKAAPKKAGA